MEVVDFGLLDDLQVTPAPEVVDFSGLGDEPAPDQTTDVVGTGVDSAAALVPTAVDVVDLDDQPAVPVAPEVVDMQALTTRGTTRSTRSGGRAAGRRQEPASDAASDDAVAREGTRRDTRRSSFGDEGSRSFGGRSRGGAGKKEPRREWGIQLDAEVDEPRPPSAPGRRPDPAGDGPAPPARGAGSRPAGRGRAGSFGRPRRAEGEPVPEYEDPEQTAKQICLTALTGASRSRKQLADLLAARDIPDDVAGAVLDRFGEVGLVDDAAFAAAWVSSRQSARGLSRRALSHELRAKGVDPEVASVALEAVDPQDEWDTARALVARKVPGMRRLDTATATRRLTGMLARKGYGMGLAAWVVREALEADGKAEDAAAVADDTAPETAGAEPVVRRGLWSGRPLDEDGGTEVGEGLTVDGYARTRSAARRPGGLGRR